MTRQKWCIVQLNEIGSNSTITEDMLIMSEILMFQHELAPGSRYYNDFNSTIKGQGVEPIDASVEVWAEVIHDKYEISSSSCPKHKPSLPAMSYISNAGKFGSGCKERVDEAISIARILGGSQ